MLILILIAHCQIIRQVSSLANVVIADNNKQLNERSSKKTSLSVLLFHNNGTMPFVVISSSRQLRNENINYNIASFNFALLPSLLLCEKFNHRPPENEVQ
jgi:hypothetical protein